MMDFGAVSAYRNIGPHLWSFDRAFDAERKRLQETRVPIKKVFLLPEDFYRGRVVGYPDPDDDHITWGTFRRWKNGRKSGRMQWIVLRLEGGIEIQLEFKKIPHFFQR